MPAEGKGAVAAKNGESDDAGEASKKAKKLGWTMDVFKMKIPDAPVSGTVYGEVFAIDSIKVENGSLTFRQGTDFFPDKALTVVFFLSPTESLSGRQYKIRRTDSRVPTIRVQYRQQGAPLPGTKTFNRNYAMRLEFGQISEAARTIQGRIFVCLPDGGQTILGGTFEAEIVSPQARTATPNRK